MNKNKKTLRLKNIEGVDKSKVILNNKIDLSLRDQINISQEKLLTQSFLQLLFCPTNLFKKSKSKAYNLLSYDKLLHNVV